MCQDLTHLTTHQAVHRRTLSPLFSDNMLTQYKSVVGQNCQVLSERLNRHVDSGAPVEMHAALLKLTLDIIGRVGFDHDFHAQQVHAPSACCHCATDNSATGR